MTKIRLVPFIGLALALALFAFAQCTHAELTTTVRHIAPTATDWAQLVTFDPFDPALGTPYAESLALTSTVHHDFQAKFTAPTTMTLTGGPTTVDVEGPGVTGGLFFDRVNRSASGAFTTESLAPSDVTQSRTISVPLDPNGLALQVSAASTDSYQTENGNGTGIIHTLADANLELTYCYSPHPNPIPPTQPSAVPEPASWFLAILGIVGTACMRRALSLLV